MGFEVSPVFHTVPTTKTSVDRGDLSYGKELVVQLLLVAVYAHLSVDDLVHRSNFRARRLVSPRLFELGGDCGHLVSPDRHPKERAGLPLL